MSILYLDNTDFHISNGDQTVSLCTEIQGLSLVLYFAQNCQFSQHAYNIFQQLPRYLNGCQFGIMNLSKKQNIQVAHASMSSTTPIQQVPTIILYYNGSPVQYYTDQLDPGMIGQFVMDMWTIIQENTVKSNGRNGRHRIAREYSVGVPLYGDDKSLYLDFSGIGDWSGHVRRK
jgi:hypothetical protein